MGYKNPDPRYFCPGVEGATRLEDVATFNLINARMDDGM